MSAFGCSLVMVGFTLNFPHSKTEYKCHLHHGCSLFHCMCQTPAVSSHVSLIYWQRNILFYPECMICLFRDVILISQRFRRQCCLVTSFQDIVTHRVEFVFTKYCSQVCGLFLNYEITLFYE